MPDINLLQRPSREGGDSLQDQGELHRVYVSCSCELAKASVPSVSKAKGHIQELKNKLEKWCRQGIDDQGDHSGGKNENGVIWRFDSTNYAIPVTSTELCIEGTGLCLLRNYEGKTLDLFWKGTDGMGGVLLEVLSLIERLESGRQGAREALRDERQKAQRLRRKQDRLSLWKQQQFPAAVQLEYEVCTRDITELKWHLKLLQEQRQQVRSSLSLVEAQNCQLVDNIDFLVKHEPLVKEKLQLESEVMKQIESAQAQASDTFTKLSCDLRKSQVELENEEVKAEKEREVMTMELKDVCNQLEDRLTEVQQLKSYWGFYCLKVCETEEKTVLKHTELDAMIQKIMLLETQEVKINDAVVELRAKLEDQEKELREKHDELTSFQKQIQATKGEEEEQVSEYEKICSRKRQELWHLHGENKEYEMEIEDYNKKISQSKHAVKQLHSKRKQILEKITQIEEQRDQAEEELNRQATQHATTRASVEDLEQQTVMQGQRMRKETEKQKVQLMNETKVVLVLKGNIALITDEFNLAKADCERVEYELVKEYDDASCTAAQLESEMVELREIHAVKSKIIENLKWKLSDALNQHTKLSDELDQQKIASLEHLDTAKKAHNAFSVRCDQVSRRIVELRRESEEFRKVSDAMEHVAANMPCVIEELQSMSDVVEYKHNAAGLVMSGLQGDMEACRTKTAHIEETHSTLLSQRDTTMQDLQANLKEALKENAQLAQEYRVQQKALMVAKREAVRIFTENNRAETSFHDHKQLSLLQRRMHKAMLKYFKHRSVYSQAELARFQALSNQNNQKMKALQEQLSRAIQRVSAFLHSLTDDSSTSHDTVSTVADTQRCLDSDGLSGAMHTVQIAE